MSVHSIIFPEVPNEYSAFLKQNENITYLKYNLFKFWFNLKVIYIDRILFISSHEEKG